MAGSEGRAGQGRRRQRVTPGQRPRPNYGHPQAKQSQVAHRLDGAGREDMVAIPGLGMGGYLRAREVAQHSTEGKLLLSQTNRLLGAPHLGGLAEAEFFD